MEAETFVTRSTDGAVYVIGLIQQVIWRHYRINQGQFPMLMTGLIPARDVIYSTLN